MSKGKVVRAWAIKYNGLDEYMLDTTDTREQARETGEETFPEFKIVRVEIREIVGKGKRK
jgi:hypothetical protein